jgi:hypothetical protein
MSDSKLGRPAKILDEEEIAQFVCKGYAVEWVANYLGVSERTLYRNYCQAQRNGRVFRNGCLQAKQFRPAMAKNDVTMQIWLGKQWLGQRDKTETSNDEAFGEVERLGEER